jgi:acetylglutamate kinase
MIADGTISGGMIPKVNGCADLVRGGVKRVFIIDGRVPHSILVEILTDEGIGTMVLE